MNFYLSRQFGVKNSKKHNEVDREALTKQTSKYIVRAAAAGGSARHTCAEHNFSRVGRTKRQAVRIEQEEEEEEETEEK